MDDWIIIISALALFISGISLFFQFFHKPKKVRAISMPFTNEGDYRLGICNGGKVTVFIIEISAYYFIEIQGGGTQGEHASKVFQDKDTIIEPGKISDFSVNIAEPSDFLLANLPGNANESGEVEKSADVFVCIRYAFPDGATYEKKFIAGTYSVAENMTNFSTPELNINLLESAEKA
jgi:hypothetical protein